MRVLIVHNQLWAHYKSKLFEAIHEDLSEKVPAAAFMVAQIGLYESGRREMQSVEQEVYRYPYRVLFPRSLDQIPLSDRIKGLFGMFFDFKPTILNITGYYDWAQVLLMCYAKLRGVKVVISTESSVYDQKRNPVKERMKRWIVNLADACFCFGTTSVDYLKSLGIPETKIAVRHAAVIDDVRIREQYLTAKRLPAPSTRNFIFAGRFSPEKNLPALLNAYAAARKQHPAPWGLILVGDGPVKPEIETYLDREALSGVKLTGGVSWLEVPQWMAQADVLILPSYSEPWGLVVNEALVCGLAVIVSDRCGCAKDLVAEGQSGYTFAPFDEKELCRLMLYFMNASPEELMSYTHHGRAIVRKFAAGKVAGEMADTFISLNGDTPTK